MSSEAKTDNGQELYRRFREGDAGAFEELVGFYREALTKYINGFVNDTHEAEELMIDAFAQLDADERFEGRSSVKTYLFAIARNISQRHVKNRGRGGHIPIDDIMEMTSGNSGSPETEYLRGERGGKLRALIQTLKPEYRDVLNLLYFENKSYAEAGGVMSKTEKQIKNLTYRAKASLKKKLESEGMTYED